MIRARNMLKGFILGISLLLVAPSQVAKAVEEMMTFQLFLLKQNPAWRGKTVKDEQHLDSSHREFLESLNASDQILISGPVTDGNELKAIVVASQTIPNEALSIVKKDPAVKDGMLNIEAYSWYAAKGIMKKTKGAAVKSNYYFGLLVRGPRWTPEVTPEVTKLQEAHMANIRRMGESGKLVIAGPIENGGQLRGVYVFKLGSLQEAISWAETDPAIKAGRLMIEIHSWQVNQGSLP